MYLESFDHMERREFLKRAGQAAALAAVTGSAAYLFYNRKPFAYAPRAVKRPAFDLGRDTSFPLTAACTNADPIVALNQSLDAVGGIKRFVRPGERVTIKPNVGWDRTPEQAADTNPVLVAQMVSLCLVAGAREVIVSDISCNDPRRCFVRSGIRDAAEKAGAKVYLPQPDDFQKANFDGIVLKEWDVLKWFVETDRLINMPIVKHHGMSACTVGMKNLYGVLGGPRHQLHQQIDQSIVDLTAYFKPTLTVVDATHVLLRNGPQGGSTEDVISANSVICSTDPVGADSRAVEFMGLRGDHVGHIVLAEKSGLGQIDYRAAGYREITS